MFNCSHNVAPKTDLDRWAQADDDDEMQKCRIDEESVWTLGASGDWQPAAPILKISQLYSTVESQLDLTFLNECKKGWF